MHTRTHLNNAHIHQLHPNMNGVCLVGIHGMIRLIFETFPVSIH